MDYLFLKSSPGDNPVISEAVFKSSPSRIFQAWTTPDQIVCWFGQKPHSIKYASIDLCLSGKWMFSFSEEHEPENFLHGEYLEIKPDKRLVFTWSHCRTDENGQLISTPVSKVKVELRESEEGTIVTVHHEGIVKEEGRLGVANGWASGLVSLQEYLKS